MVSSRMDTSLQPNIQLLAMSIYFSSILLSSNLVLMKYLKTKFDIYKPMFYFSAISILSCLSWFYAFYSLDPQFYVLYIIAMEISLLPFYMFFRSGETGKIFLLLDIAFFTITLIIVVFTYNNGVETLEIGGYLILYKARTETILILKFIQFTILGFVMFHLLMNSPSYGKKILFFARFLAYMLVVFIIALFVLNVFFSMHLTIVSYILYSLVVLDVTSLFVFFPSVILTTFSKLYCICLLNNEGILISKIGLEETDKKTLADILDFVFESLRNPYIGQREVYFSMDGISSVAYLVNDVALVLVGKNLKRDLAKFIRILSDRFNGKISLIVNWLAEIYGLS